MAGEARTLRLLHQEAIVMDEGQPFYTPWVAVQSWVRKADFIVDCLGYYGGNLDVRLQASMDQTATEQLAAESVTGFGLSSSAVNSALGPYVRLYLEVPATTGPTAMTISVYLLLRTAE